MNTERIPENNNQDSDNIGFASVTPPRKPRRKRSAKKKQIVTTVAIVLCIAILGGAVGFVLNFFTDKDGIVDTFTESHTTPESGKINYTYYSKADGTGFKITDVNGNTLTNYYVDESGNMVGSTTAGATHVYETVMGSMLMTTPEGKISYFAMVDYGGKYVGGDTSVRVLMFPRISQGDISEIFVHHSDDEGKVTEYTVVGSDTNKDKKNDSFMLKGFENAMMNQTVVAAMCSFAGYTITLNKLSLDFMKDYDNQHKNETGYTPILNPDGKINFAEYGLEGGDGADYYELKTLGGEIYRVYIGNKVPDGSGLYVRFANAGEGDRNAVYVIADDPGISNLVGISLSRTGVFLAQPEELVYPQINVPTTLNTYLLVDDFTLMKKDADVAGGYKTLTNFSYVDLAIRNYTLNQTHPYIMNDPDILSGYLLNDTKIDAALMDLYDISSIIGNDYSTSAVKNYVSVLKLVKNVLPDEFSNYYDDMSAEIVKAVDKAVEDDEALRAILAEYGLDQPENKLFYSSLVYSAAGTVTNDSIPNYIWISDMTENKTYYVWAPIYQQILEVGASYFDMLEYDEYDWASSTVFDANIAFCDSIRVTGNDKDGVFRDILFELTHEYELTFAWDYIYYSGSTTDYYDIEGSKYNLIVDVNEDGEFLLTLTSKVTYGVTYISNAQTGETTEGTENHSVDFIKDMNIETIKNYAKYFLDSSVLDSLSSDEYKALENYSSLFTNKEYNRITKQSNGTVKIEHIRTDLGAAAESNPDYYFVPATNYIMTFIFDPATGFLTLSVKQVNGGIAVEVFSERVCANLVADIVKNDGKPEFTKAERTEIDNLYSKITSKRSTQTKLRVTKFDKDGNVIETATYENDANDKTATGSVYMTAFRGIYTTFLYATYVGRVTDELGGGVVGTVLDEAQMEAYKAKGDDCDVKVEIKLGVDNTAYVLRMYHYSATRTYITSNGDGVFYVDRDRAEKFIADAVKASNGDANISSDKTY